MWSECTIARMYVCTYTGGALGLPPPSLKKFVIVFIIQVFLLILTEGREENQSTTSENKNETVCKKKVPPPPPSQKNILYTYIPEQLNSEMYTGGAVHWVGLGIYPSSKLLEFPPHFT